MTLLDWVGFGCGLLLGYMIGYRRGGLATEKSARRIVGEEMAVIAREIREESDGNQGH